MPILERIFSNPLSKALKRFAWAFSGVTLASPRDASSATRSRARYGHTAPAPKPTRSATSATSRTSAVSTMRLTFARRPSRTRWLCTAAVASSAGTGAIVASQVTSLSTSSAKPSSTAFTESASRRQSASSRAAPGSPSVEKTAASFFARKSVYGLRPSLRSSVGVSSG